MGVTVSEHFKLKNFGNAGDEELFAVFIRGDDGEWIYLPHTLSSSMLKELATLIRSEVGEDVGTKIWPSGGIEACSADESLSIAQALGMTARGTA